MKHTLILSCSHRQNSVSKQVAQVCQSRIESSFSGAVVELYDFGTNPLPLWDEGVWNQESKWQQQLGPLINSAESCDSIIVIVPEYSGMAAPGAKNVMLFLTSEMVAHKPACLVSVSAGIGGSYPIAEMRMSSYKNNRLLWLPDHVILRSATDFKAPFEGKQQQENSQRLDCGLKMLNEYAKVLPAVRQSEAFKTQAFDFGQ